MTNLTELETRVFNQAEEHCMNDYCSDAKQLAEDLNLPINTVKGAVGSLIKKGKMQANQEERGGEMFYDLNTITPNGNLQCYGEQD